MNLTGFLFLILDLIQWILYAYLAFGTVYIFIFSMGRLTPGAPPIMPKGGFINPAAYADPGFVQYLKTSATSTRSIAGVIRDVDSAGVWIEI